MGLHTGEATPTGAEGYTSIAVHQAARICSAAHGGQVLASAATVEAAKVPAGVILRDIGDYHLRDFEQPVRLSQVVAAGLAEEFPAVRAVPRAAHNVPEVFTSFVGRERELGLVARALGSPGQGAHRLVTLVGAGGVGKTRMAFETTRRLAAGYSGGAWMVLLAGEHDDAVADAVATVTGARDTAGVARTDTLVERLSVGPLLLVLDNCEHVADAVASLVHKLLAACPELTVLATSREPLRIAGEHIVRLDPLDVPGEADVSPAAVAATEAARLFLQRAEAADAGFELDERTAPAVAAICRRLDGVPLAIELAAARVRHLPVVELAVLLRDRFTILTSHERDTDPRHQTLRATIAWSHQLLSEQERVLFRRLSVFRGPFTLDAVEHVCSGGVVARADIFDLVTSLVDKSLVMLADTRTALRYRMLVTIGDYAREQLVATAEHDVIAEAHLRYVVTRLRQLSPVSVEREPATVFNDLTDIEWEATTALDRALTGAGVADAQVIATRLARLHFFRGTHRQGLDLVRRALQLHGGEDDLRAWLHYRQALFHAVMGDPASAQAPIDAAVELAEHSQDPELPSSVWHVAGDVAFMREDHGRARHCYDAARTLSHDPELDALLAIRIAELDAGGEATVAVADAYGAAADHFRASGDLFNVARCLTGYGAALMRLGDDRAADALAEAVDIAAGVAAEADAALAAVLLATSCVRLGRTAVGARLLAGVDSWERQHGPAIDAMLVAHADDVRDAVRRARAAVAEVPVDEVTPEATVELARSLRQRVAAPAQRSGAPVSG
jgi:predicted ATPase